MFYLWHEAYDKNHPKFSVVKFQDKLGLQQYDRYEKLDNIISDSLGYQNYEHYFLLDDSRFHYFRFDVYKELQEPLTMADLDKIIDERLEHLKSITKEELLFPSIDNIYVD
jgi:hypothetical protein